MRPAQARLSICIEEREEYVHVHVYVYICERECVCVRKTSESTCFAKREGRGDVMRRRKEGVLSKVFGERQTRFLPLVFLFS